MASTVKNPLRLPPVGTSILDQLAEIDAHGLSSETARRILDIGFNASHQARVAALAERSQAGTLTPDERAEYSEYVHVADVLAILKSKARQVVSCRVRSEDQ